MSDDILAKIDAAVGCHSCAGVLADDSPSGDFCSAECQAEWHAAHVVPLVGYREPWYRPGDFPGVGTEAFRPAPQRVETGASSWYLRMSDQEPAEEARVPVGRWGRVAMAVGSQSDHAWPVIDWSRTPVFTSDLGSEWVHVDPGEFESDVAVVVSAREVRGADGSNRGWSIGLRWIDEVAEMFAVDPALTREYARDQLGSGSWPFAEDDAPAGEAEALTVQERALRARQTRNTGPVVRRRAPRRIDSPRSR